MPLIYTLDGDIEKLYEDCNYECDFIRKMLKKNDKCSLVEFEIARMIKEKPHPNLVKVLGISNDPMFVDYQLLDVEYDVEENERNQYINDIREGIKHLHSLNVVYIDFKNEYGDNIGYDKTTNTYRIYDFDVSAIMKKNQLEWLEGYEPPEYYNYKAVHKYYADDTKDEITQELCKKKELTKIDELLFYFIYRDVIY